MVAEYCEASQWGCQAGELGETRRFILGPRVHVVAAQQDKVRFERVDAIHKLRHLGRFFSASVSATEIPRGRGKPAPDIFLQAAKLLGVLPAGCTVIEDSKLGIAAGLAAGMRVIAIANTHPVEELATATHVVTTYAEIERILLPAA